MPASNSVWLSKAKSLKLIVEGSHDPVGIILEMLPISAVYWRSDIVVIVFLALTHTQRVVTDLTDTDK